MLALTNQVGVRFSDVVARLTPCRNLISSANKQKLDIFSRLCCACMLFWEKSVLFFLCWLECNRYYGMEHLKIATEMS